MYRIHRGPAAALCALLLVGACDLPTGIPLWDTRWDIVVLSDTVATADLLPEDMRVTEEGFVLDAFESEGQVRLGDVCELCTCFEGPIPPIEIAPHDWPVELPQGVLSASIVRGRADVVIHNEVGFDVLDDGEGGRGFLEVQLVDSWTDEVLEALVVAEPFPPGDSLVLSFDLPVVELSPRIVARVSGRTPGTPCEVALTTESGFRTSVALKDVVSESVEVVVSDADLAVPGREFELPAWLVERLRPGDAEVVLEVEIHSSLPAGIELAISAAGRADRLFTDAAALYTPLLLPAASSGGGSAVRKEYLVDLEALSGADRLYVATETRVMGSRVVRMEGGESVAYTVRLRARVPTR